MTRPLHALLLLVLLAGARPVAAQEREIRGLVEGSLAVTGVHGRASPMFGFGVGLGLSPRTSVGGAAWIVPRRDAGRVALQDVDLSFGYAGLFVEHHRSLFGEGATTAFARLLVGAGNADVSDRVTSVRLDSDNFFAAQPTAGVATELPWRFDAAAGLSYRMVWGVDDLRGIDASDIRSWTIEFRVRISPL